MAEKVQEVVSILKDALSKIEDGESRDMSRANVHVADAIQNDLKRAFPSLSGGGKRLPIPAKKGKKSASKVSFFIQPKESWTHEFCLLSSTTQDTSPSFDELSELRQADLGRRKIVFPCKTGNFEHLKKTLEKEFVKLKTQDGAFEFLRAESGGISRPLKLVSMPSDGYSIPYLKNLLGTNTVIYIRPMKSCISKEKLPQVVTATSPFTECPKCDQLIPIFSLRQHVSVCQAIEIDDDTEKELEVPVFETGSSLNVEASSSTGTSFIDEGVVALFRIFPDHDIDTVRQALIRHGSIEEAADALSAKDDNTAKKSKETEVSVHDTLKKLKTKMKSPISAERLKVDEEDIAIDFLQFYKSKEFDAAVPITVRYKRQPGVDSGGLMRQAFTTVFGMLANNEVPGIRLFTGPSNRVTPIYSSENLLTSIFETIGKMVAHSLIQGGPGFPYLAPAVFWYVATGDLSEGISRAACVDVVDPELCIFLDRVREAEPGYIAEIAQDPDFVSLCQECGEVRTLTERNKFQVIQTLILHATVLKHKAALDQFRKGLGTLGLLTEIEKNPKKFEKFFVHSEEQITAVFVKNLLKPPQTSTCDSDKTVEMLYTFIDKADCEDLSEFLSFTTGSKLNTGALKPHCISVSVQNDQGFFASTCSLELTLPVISTYSEFEILLRAVITGKKFTTV